MSHLPPRARLGNPRRRGRARARRRRLRDLPARRRRRAGQRGRLALQRQGRRRERCPAQRVRSSAAAERSKTGSDPAPPSEDEIKHSPGAAVAGLFLVGFRGTLRDTPFLKRLAAIPYGGLLLTENNYEQPQQLSGLTSKLQEVAREAGHPAPLDRRQAGGRRVQRVRQPRARGAGRRRGGHARLDRHEREDGGRAARRARRRRQPRAQRRHRGRRRARPGPRLLRHPGGGHERRAGDGRRVQEARRGRGRRSLPG